MRSRRERYRSTHPGRLRAHRVVVRIDPADRGILTVSIVARCVPSSEFEVVGFDQLRQSAEVSIGIDEQKEDCDVVEKLGLVSCSCRKILDIACSGLLTSRAHEIREHNEKGDE